jgi:hypothetical protein
MDATEQEKVDQDCLEAIADTLMKLGQAKPKDRGELARRYAVTITELEKAYAYFRTWVIEEGPDD